jgi:hypothetical protein
VALSQTVAILWEGNLGSKTSHQMTIFVDAGRRTGERIETTEHINQVQ